MPWYAFMTVLFDVCILFATFIGIIHIDDENERGGGAAFFYIILANLLSLIFWQLSLNKG